MTPAGSRFVALADQDDHWYPDKLATLVDSIGDAALAYSDMRIVDESGAVLSPTFWSSRRNNHTNLASLLLANTVTGAASLLRRELVDLALPFPPAPGSPFHDQWLASLALATGGIEYVDRPLYDYVQHRSGAFGHAAAMHGYRPGRLLRPLDPAGSLRRIAEHGQRTYVANACRLALMARALELRVGPSLSGSDRRAVQRVANLARPPEPVGWLALRSLRSAAGLNETMGIELSILTAVLWRRFGRWTPP